MKDRVPTNPNRYLITPEDGSPPFYGTLTRADNPIDEGTLLGKASLLPDSVESAIWGSAADRTVAQALQQLRSLISTAQSTANTAYNKVRMVTGTYTGTGSAQTINLGFTPKFFALKNRATVVNASNQRYELICIGIGENITVIAHIRYSGTSMTDMSHVTTLNQTITIPGTYPELIYSGAVYDYFAIG